MRKCEVKHIFIVEAGDIASCEEERNVASKKN